MTKNVEKQNLSSITETLERYKKDFSKMTEDARVQQKEYDRLEKEKEKI